VISCFSALSCILGRASFLNSLWLLAVPSGSFSALLFYGGLIGFRQDFTIDDFEKEIHRDDILEAKGTEYTEGENGIRMQLLKNNLISLLKDQQLYTQSDLRITDLAQKLGSNRAYVSRIINQQLDTNFSDLINSYRLEHAKKLLLDSRYPVSMEEIAESSGFPSQSTFYRVFKQELDMSPKIWRKKQLMN